MEYCEIIFAKKLSNLSFEDIESYFNEERIETDQLEFKSINEKTKDEDSFSSLRRTICALLNSQGGVLIWGAPLGTKLNGRKEAIFKGALTSHSGLIEKDLLISKISDGIVPLPNSIRVKIYSRGNNCIAILEVDPSEYPPHRTNDIYYMRIDGQSKPAPHHYVEALFKKTKYPTIEAVVNFRDLHDQMGETRIIMDVIFFNWSPLQNEEQLSFRMITDGIFHESSAQGYFVQAPFSLDGHEYFKVNVKDVFYYGEPVIETRTIAFSPRILKINDNKGRVMVAFGGRFSPLKSSEFILDFSKTGVTNANELVIRKRENKLAKDLHLEKEMDKTKIIDLFISELTRSR